ncbi:hypothetical protein Goshw_022619, partial [Gossypium schwendimanii]|nr:hypothetical protein [Gossypium schwendimanii]
ILFIIFSPTGKPYLFGHPSVEYVAKQFLIPSQPLNETIHAPVKAYRKKFRSHNTNNGYFFSPIVRWKRNSSLVENYH